MSEKELFEMFEDGKKPLYLKVELINYNYPIDHKSHSFFWFKPMGRNHIEARKGTDVWDEETTLEMLLKMDVIKEFVKLYKMNKDTKGV